MDLGAPQFSKLCDCKVGIISMSYIAWPSYGLIYMKHFACSVHCGDVEIGLSSTFQITEVNCCYHPSVLTITIITTSSVVYMYCPALSASYLLWVDFTCEDQGLLCSGPRIMEYNEWTVCHIARLPS